MLISVECIADTKFGNYIYSEVNLNKIFASIKNIMVLTKNTLFQNGSLDTDYCQRGTYTTHRSASKLIEYDNLTHFGGVEE